MTNFKEMFETETNDATLEELKVKYNLWFMIDSESNELLVQKEGEAMKNYPLPKKITSKWIETKLIHYTEFKSPYKNLSKVFKRLIKNTKFYATTYGIGLSIALDSEQKIKEKLKPVFELLDNNDITYRLEYSRAFWVYKIIISKSNKNLSKIKKIN